MYIFALNHSQHDQVIILPARDDDAVDCPVDEQVQRGHVQHLVQVAVDTLHNELMYSIWSR